jgi:AbiV family abortive infection protein
MDLRAVRVATRDDLVACAVAAATNAHGLVRDAELLLTMAGSTGRAFSLAVLAVEEAGKAVSLAALVGFRTSFQARAPVRRLLESHQMKHVLGMLFTVLPFGSVATRLAVMPPAELERTLATLVPADDADRLKRRGLYVDLEKGGRISAPTEVTWHEAAAQLGQARRAAESVGAAILGPKFEEWLADPPDEALELAEDVIAAISESTSPARTPEDATRVIRRAVEMFRDRRNWPSH